MPITLPVDTYEVFEKNFGKEDAKTLIKTFEMVISDATDYKWKVTKEELLDAIEKKFITRELFEERMTLFEIKMGNNKVELKSEILEAMRKEFVTKELLDEKLQTLKAELTSRFTVMFLILLFTIIFLNQNALEFIAKVIGLTR